MTRLIAHAMLGLCVIAAISSGGAYPAIAEELFVSKRIAPSGEYTSGIEGPAASAAGDLYVMNIKQPDNPTKKGAIGRLKPGASKSELFSKLPGTSIGNGARFDRQGRMYVADFPNHNIFVFEPDPTLPPTNPPAAPLPQPRLYSSESFNQPNDLAIGLDGTLYASDPNAPMGTGQIWQITRGPDGKGHGIIMSSPERPIMGITNGIDLSPDNKTLYVGESQRNTPRRIAQIWAYRIEGTTLAAPVKIHEFPQGDVDGLRTDIDGRIFVARPSFGTVAVLKPDGTPARPDITTSGHDPTNLSFGGADGRDVFVTQADGRFIERFRTDRPGREPCTLALSIPGC